MTVGKFELSKTNELWRAHWQSSGKIGDLVVGDLCQWLLRQSQCLTCGPEFAYILHVQVKQVKTYTNKL